MPITVTAETAAKLRCRKKESCSSGAGDRSSAMTNAARKTAARTKPPMTCQLPQPVVGPWMTANSSVNTATAIVSWPGQSSDRPSGAEESWARKKTPALTTASTRMTRKAQRQPAYTSEP